MKTLVRVLPCEYGDNSVAIVYPCKGILERLVEIQNRDELAGVLRAIKAEVSADAQIFLKPLSRKFPGFAKAKEELRADFYLEKRA